MGPALALMQVKNLLFSLMRRNNPTGRSNSIVLAIVLFMRIVPLFLIRRNNPTGRNNLFVVTIDSFMRIGLLLRNNVFVRIFLVHMGLALAQIFAASQVVFSILIRTLSFVIGIASLAQMSAASQVGIG